MGGTSSLEFKNSEYVDITPDKALGIFANGRYVYPEPRRYILKEKILSFSGDDFDIKDENEDIVFKMKGKVFSIGEKKKLLSREGEPLGWMKEKIFTGHGRLYLIDDKDHVRVVVRKQKILQINKVVEAWILHHPLHINEINKKETKERDPDILLEGNWRAKQFLMRPYTRDYQPVDEHHPPPCYVKIQPGSSLSAKHIFFGVDSYTVNVAPNVDSCLAVLLTIALDELYRDDRKN